MNDRTEKNRLVVAVIACFAHVPFITTCLWLKGASANENHASKACRSSERFD
jgi:hypothetical protein